MGYSGFWCALHWTKLRFTVGMWCLLLRIVLLVEEWGAWVGSLCLFILSLVNWVGLSGAVATPPHRIGPALHLPETVLWFLLGWEILNDSKSFDNKLEILPIWIWRQDCHLNRNAQGWGCLKTWCHQTSGSNLIWSPPHFILIPWAHNFLQCWSHVR